MGLKSTDGGIAVDTNGRLHVAFETVTSVQSTNKKIIMLFINIPSQTLLYARELIETTDVADQNIFGFAFRNYNGDNHIARLIFSRRVRYDY